MFENLPPRTAVWWSGGLDSTLLLAMLIEEHATFDVIQMRDHWTKGQKKRVDALIKQWDLKLFSYAPMFTNVIGQDDDLALVHEYAVNGGAVPMLMDVVEGEQCLLNALKGLRRDVPPLDWDLMLIGSRKDDTHWAFGNVIPSEKWTVGSMQIWAPFYDKDREWVKQELRVRGLDDSEVSEQENTGNVSFCTNCLHDTEAFCPLENKFIPAIQWDRSKNLAAFQTAYGIKPNN